MRNRSCRWLQSCLLPMALFLLEIGHLRADGVPSGSQGPRPKPIVEYHGGGTRYSVACQEFEHATRLAAAGDACCVDWFFSCAQKSWDDLAEGLMDDSPRLGRGTLHLYNSAVLSCVVNGHRLGRLSPTQGLRVAIGEAWQTVPIVSVGLHWKLDQIDCVRPIDSTLQNPTFAESVRYGAGASLIGIHYRRPDVPGEEHYLEQHPFPITAVLRGGKSGAYQLEFHNPVTHQTIDVAGREMVLSSNIAGAIQFALERLLADVNPVTAFLNPEVAVDYKGLLLLQPYQPGKIPIVLVHGLLSNPAYWGPLINVLLNNPALMERYQIWGYLYPTGVSILRTAAELRSDLKNTLSFLDPAQQDPALQNMVLIGHSMGGLLARLQVTWSGNHVWDEFANVPFGQIRGDARSRQALLEMFFFGPQPFVNRVVFMAVPHQGSNWNSCVLRLLGRCCAGRPLDLVELWNTINLLNPTAFPFRYRRGLPSSLEALAADSPLLRAIAKMPFSSRVRLHSIIGTGGCEPCCEGDGLVPVESARLLGVESELFVDATHEDLKEHPDTIREVQRILWVHWSEYTQDHRPVAPTSSSPVRVPAPAQ